MGSLPYYRGLEGLYRSFKHSYDLIYYEASVYLYPSLCTRRLSVRGDGDIGWWRLERGEEDIMSPPERILTRTRAVRQLDQGKKFQLILRLKNR